MIDYALKFATEADFNALMLSTGLCVQTDDGINPVNSNVLIDRIGPITLWDYSTDPATSKSYPEYYVNLRLLADPDADTAAAIDPYAIDPSSPQYRVWS